MYLGEAQVAQMASLEELLRRTTRYQGRQLDGYSRGGKEWKKIDDFELGFLATTSSIIKNPYSYGFFLDILSPEEKRPYYS